MNEPLDPPPWRETRDEEIENRLRELERTTRWMLGLKFVQKLRALVEDDPEMPDVSPASKELIRQAIAKEEERMNSEFPKP